MKIARMLSILGLPIVLSFLFEPIASAQVVIVGEPPTITHAFAPEKGSYAHGYIWKIYIEAEAGDAPMDKIAAVVEQDSGGAYPIEWINLKSQYQKQLKGYIQWNMRSSTGGLQDGTTITLRVSIFDKKKSASNRAVFYFTFESGAKGQYQLPAPFDQGDIPRLGYLNIDLRPPGSRF